MDLIGIPAHHKMDGLACGKVGLIDQLQRLPVRRGLAEAVEHRPAPCGKIQGKGRGICRILTVEGRCKAAAADRLAVAPGSEAHAQGIELVGGGDLPAEQVAGPHGQRFCREIFHREIDQRTAQTINLLYFLPTAGMGLLSHGKSGLLEKPVLRSAIPAGLTAAALAAWLSFSVDTELLRRPFGVYLLLAAASLLLQTKKGGKA